MGAFKQGDIVVYRIASSAALTSAAASVFLDEYAPDGTLVQEIALPTADSGTNHGLVGGGTSSSEGILNLSADGQYLLLTGFDAAVATTAVASSAATTLRVVGRVGADGTIDTSTTFGISTDVRSVASANGSSYYIGTNNSAQYEAEAGTSATTLGTLNSRDIELYGSQLYYDTSSAVGKFGIAGPPTGSGQTATPFTFGTAPGSNLGDFFLADLDGTPGLDTLYIVDGTNGLEKYSLVGSTWTLNSAIKTVGGTTISGFEGLTASVTGTTVSLYVTTPTRILSLTDSTGYNVALTATNLTSVVDHSNTSTYPNQAFRGVSFAPTAAVVAPTPGTFALSGNISQNEDAGAQAFTITRTGGSSGAVTISYVVTGTGTHAAGTDDFTGAALPSGTVTFADGDSSAHMISIPVAADTVYEPDETYTLTLSNPTNGGVLGTATATGTILNDDPAPPVGTFALAAGVSQAEDAGDQVFTINRTGGAAGAATISYAVTGSGTYPADANDFMGTALPNGTVTFADGQTSATVAVHVAADSTYEPDETYTLTLSNPTTGTLGTATAQGTIVNDDAPPPAGTFALAANVSQAEDAGDQVFTINRTSGSAGAATITYAVAGTGTNPANANDFTGAALPSGTVNFADGQTSATIAIHVAADTAYEPDETYTLTLSNPTAGTLGQATATGTVVNDDPAPPTLSINNPAVVEGNAGTTTLIYTVTASAAATVPITFHYATADGTATAGSGDYVATSGTGTIAAGATSTTVAVTVNGDTVVEPNETVLLSIDTPTNATVATGQGTGTIVSDDLPATATLLSTDFINFTAKGFSPGATAASGMLDSNIWRVGGLSDNPNPAYGFTGATGSDFGRGVIDSTSTSATVKDPVSAGVYYPANNGALIIQPTGAEFDVNGFIEARLANTTGETITSVDVAFDWTFRNSAARGDNLELFYSTDGVNFTAVPATAFTTPTTADTTLAANFTNQPETVHLDNIVVGNGNNLYLRWEHPSSSGSGSRDEVGIDNVQVIANLSSAPAISASDVAQAEGNSGTTNFVFTLTRSDPTGVATVHYATADGTATAGNDYQATSGTATFADGQLTTTVTVLVNGDIANEANESFYLNLTNPSSGLTLPDPQGLGTIQNDDTGPVAIYDIQGAGQMSPFAGQSVTTTGVVTQVVAHGFYIQDPMGDGNSATSDAIYVYLGSTATPNVVVGNAVSVVGTIAEYVGGTDYLPLTEINGPSANVAPTVTVTAQVAALPAPVLISADGDGRAPPTQYVDDDHLTSYDPTSDGADFYESLEGMLVTIKNPLVVGNTYQGATFVVASNGVGATGLNSRDGLTLEATDQQPEKIKIYDTTETHVQGEQLGSVTGILTYSGGEYEVDPVQKVTTASLANSAADTARETTNIIGDAGHLSYASFNLENLSPVPDNNGNDTQAEIDARFATHANEIVNALHSPDIIGVQEVQDNDGDLGTTALSGLQTAQKLIDAIAAAGGPTYKYIEIAPTANGTSGGDPNGNIRDGFLYNPARVTYVDGSAHRLDNSVFAGTRYPLVADFTFNGQTFTAIDQHSTSRGGSDPVYASIQPPTQLGDSSRTAQADAIQQYIIAQEQNDPTHTFIVNGDFNGYYYENALTDLVTGTNLTNLYGKLAPEERYSYYFDGTYEAFDNILVSSDRYADSSFDVVHYNAGYADGLSTTDHDQVVAAISFARGTGPAMAIADTYATTAAAILHGTVIANDTGGGTTISVEAINGDTTRVGTADRLASGALLTLNVDGSFNYDTDGAFGSLAAGATATDSFTYTLAGGSTATATITITGIATPAPDTNGHINGTSGNDTYSGTTGADYFDLSAGGNDTVDGGAGADAFYLGATLTAIDHINGGSGINAVGLQGDYTGSNALVLSATTLTNIEALSVLPGGSTPHSYDITSNDAIVGTGQTFTVFAGNLAAGENITFNGSAETDGSFLFFGGAGTDTVTGGAKDDAFFFGPDKFGAADVVHGSSGLDTIGLDGHTASLTLDSTHTDVEVLALLRGVANAAPDTYGVITVDDSWVSAGQTKTITAVTSFQSSVGPVVTSLVVDGSHETDGNLNIYGGTANDTLIGGAGADHLYGGLGADILTGSTGADVFLYNDPAESTGNTFDTLTDFTIGSDTINIAGQGADSYTTVTTGNLSNATFEADLQAAVGAQLSAGHAVFFTATGGDYANQTFLVVDANGTAGYQNGGDYVIHVPAAPITPTGAADFITH